MIQRNVDPIDQDEFTFCDACGTVLDADRTGVCPVCGATLTADAEPTPADPLGVRGGGA